MKRKVKIIINKLASTSKMVTPVLKGISIIVTILGIGIIGIINPLKDSIEPIRLHNYTKVIEGIKIGSSQKYVESVLGIPQRENAMVLETKNGKYNIKRTDYYNKDFLYTCYFTDKDGLVAIGLITKNQHFKPRIPYISSTALLRESQDKYVSVCWFIKTFCAGTRSDTSDFFLEFEGYMMAANNLLIGYGISEFGYLDKNNENYFYDYIMNLISVIPDEIDRHKLNGDVTEKIFEKEALLRNKMHPNAVFVIKDDVENDDFAYDLLDQEMEFSFLYKRMDYRMINE